MLQTKRFIGNDLARLYRRVRSELGEDALIFSTRTLERDGGGPLIEIQAGPPTEDAALPLDLQQAMLSTVLSRVAPGLKVPDLEDLVLRGVLGPAAAMDVGAPAPAPVEEDYAVPEPPAFEYVPGPPPPVYERSPLDDAFDAGFEREVAEQFIGTFPGLAAEAALAAYLRRLPVAYPDEYETAVVVIDGPEGSGRSTAMLRMALDCSEAGRSAVLVTTDVSRPEEVDRLSAYAEVLGLEFLVAAADRSLERTVSKARRGSVLFVDCAPGWQAPAFLPAAVYRYLAVPARWPGGSLDTWLDANRHGSFAGAIPTFTDTATNLTPVVSTLVSLGTGIAFLSSGSDISNGIAVADANTIASGIFSMPTGGRTDGRLVASA